jgi:hypothetical protein
MKAVVGKLGGIYAGERTTTAATCSLTNAHTHQAWLVVWVGRADRFWNAAAA